MKTWFWFGRILSFAFFAALLWATPLQIAAQVQGWCEEKYLVAASTMDQRVSLPAIASEGDDVYIAYRQNGVKMIHSKDRGKTWGEPKMLSGDQTVCRDPAIVAFGSRLAVVWPTYIRSNGLTAYQMFGTESSDKGLNWTDPKRLTQTRDHVFSPRFLKTGEQAVLTWMETPLSETLGSISTSNATRQSPEALEQIFNAGFSSGGGLAAQQQQMRSLIYTSVYNPRTNIFSNPQSIDEIFTRALPYIFTLYGPVGDKLHIVVNENLEIRSYESSDGGQNWAKGFDEPKKFDPQMLLDLAIVDGERHATWIQRRPFQQIPVKFLTGDLNNSIQLSPPHYVRSVPRLDYSDGIFHAVWEAGNQNQSQLTYMRTDKTNPTSSIVRPTDPNVKEQKVSFGWVGEDNISDTNRLMYSYSIQGDTWTQPQSETTAVLDTPPDGEYTFAVRAEDVAGNIQNPVAEFQFNTFQSAPDLTLKDAPSPFTELNTRSVAIAFDAVDNSDDPSQITYSAQADDGDWTDFATGKSHTFDNLSNGQHVLRFRAKDSRGNVDPTPAECMVTIKVGLELVLVTTPPLNTNSEELSFEFTAKDDKSQPVSIDAFYKLDGGEPVQIAGEGALSLSGLDEGRHEIALWGVDASGDRTADAKYQWTVDRTPPDTVATFTKEYSNGMPLIALSARDPLIQGNIQPVTPNRYEYKIGEGDWQPLEHGGGNWLIPKPLSMISWGYVMTVRSIDVAGNVDQSPTSIDLRIFSRTNPYILYGIAAVLGILIVFLLRRALANRGGSYKPAAATAAATSTSMDDMSTDFSTSTEEKKSTFSFDDDEDDPYA